MNPFLVPYLAQMKIFENLEKYITKFTSNERIKKMLLYTSLFIGADPKNIPALYSLMSYVDLGIGTYYSNGGIGQFILALETLCKENKVVIKTNEDVQKIIVLNGKATSVKTKNSAYKADIIISAADYPFTELKLLEKKYQTYPSSYWKESSISPSAFVIYLGLNKKIKALQHHNMFLAEDWDRHFESLFRNKNLPDNPSYYVSCTSKTDPTVAPKGYENIFITAQIPAGISMTEKDRKIYFEKLVNHLESLIGEKITPYIVIKRVLAADDYNNIYNAYQNAAIGLASTFKQSIYRPSNKSKKVKNLYYAGQYTAPGAGMPMCLISAEKVADLICKNYPV
jgi:phytoene desaturase